MIFPALISRFSLK